MIDQIVLILNLLKDLSQRANINKLYISTIFRIVGIAYIAEFGSQICKDAGSSSIAMKIEFAAKIIILVLAFPILMAVMDILLEYFLIGGLLLIEKYFCNFAYR